MRVAYRMAICDDISEALDTAENMARDWANLRGFELEIDRFSSAPDFFADYENGHYDILLLDIEMGAVNGVELARRVRRGDHDAQIIFLTGYTDYIADGYDVEALNYLLKPVDRAKLFGVLDRAADRLRRQETVITLPEQDALVRLPVHRIVWAEAERNYVVIHADEVHTVRMTLGELEKSLDEYFFRTGRSFIVNLKHVQRVTRTDVVMDTGDTLPLPRGMYDPLNRAIIKYL